MHHRALQLPARRVVQLRRQRRPAAGQQPQRGDERDGGAWPGMRPAAAGLVEKRLVEGRAAARHGDSVPPVRLDRRRRFERVQHDGREAAEQHRDHVVGPGDVRVGEGDRAGVRVGRSQRGGQSDAAREERAVGVLDALGSGGRAGGVVDPRRGAVRPYEVRQRAPGAGRGLRQPVGDGQHPHPRGRHLPRRAPVVVAAPLARHDRVRGARLPQREADFTLPVQVQDGYLYGAEPGQREGHRDGQGPGGQLPQDARAGPDPQPVEPGRQPQRPVPYLPEGDGLPGAAGGLVEEHRPPRGQLRPVLRQFPQRPHTIGFEHVAS